MDKEYLLKSAQQLKQVSKKAAKEYNQLQETLVSKINTLMQEKYDLEILIGVNNIEIMKDNHNNHVRFIASILNNYNADVLVDTVLWVFRAYRSHGFATNYWSAQLNSWIGIIKETLSTESYKEIYPYYEWMQVNIPVFAKLSDDKIDAPNTLH